MYRRSKRYLSRVNSSPDGLDKGERVELAKKRKTKQAKFAWLSRFLSRRPTQESLEEKVPAKEQQLFFGIPVAVLYEDQSRLEENVPKPVYYSAQALRNWLLIEGIFRVSGIFSEMNQLKSTFERGNIPNFAEVQSKYSIAGLFELWFRELPEPITTHAFYNELFNCISDGISEEECVENLRNTLSRLPECNQTVLTFFLKFMREIAAQEDSNKMGSKNLGVVFGSILLGSEVLSFSLGLKDTLERQNRIVQLLIDNVDLVFPDIKFSKFFNES